MQQCVEQRARARRAFAPVLPVLVMLGLAAPAFSAARKLTVADVANPALRRPGLVATWIPGSRAFSYALPKGSGEPAEFEIWMEEVSSGRKTRIVSAESLEIPEQSGEGETPPADARERGRPARLSALGHRWSPDGKWLLLEGRGDLWRIAPGAAKAERLTRGRPEAEFPSFSPDGKRLAFLRGNDLYVADVGTKTETRLTSDGSEKIHNGRLDWVYQEELARRNGRAYEWSPDGSSIAYLRLDDAAIEPSPIENFLATPAKIDWQYYPKSGAKNPAVSLRVVDVTGKERRSVAPAAGDEYILPEFSWTPDSASLAWVGANRPQTRVEVRLLEMASGRSRTLFVEEDPAWINDHEIPAPRFLKNGREFLWISERSGFFHLYLGNVASGALVPVTRGSWMVDELAGVDEQRRLAYFTSTEEDVRRRHVDRIALDGTGFTRLTRGRGTHRAQLSEDGRWLLDTASDVDSPPALSLLDASGKIVREVNRAANPLAGFELAKTEEIEIKADDGATLMARLTRPADLDPSRKYPVLVSLYGGPHGQVVVDRWGATSAFDHFLATHGYLVWSLDNRGSWGRGHAWESVLLRETGKHELADQLAGVRYLKSLPYVDGARLGITGGSYGGYMTLYALTNSPEVWKCGIAGAPVTHWKFYDTIYTERYMRTPQENPKGYEASAPLTKAKDLRARLLLYHGTADDNVHLQNTVAFVDALIQAGKTYELLLVPRQKHGVRGRPATDVLYATMWKFLEENL